MCRGNRKRGVTTMVTYSQASTPLGQSERAYYLSYFINQYSNMTPRLSGQTSIYGVVSFVSKSLMGIEGQKKREIFAILTRKPRSHA